MDQSLAVDSFITNDPAMKKCPRPERARLVSVMDLVRFAQGQSIFNEDDPATYVYYVIEGSVEIQSSEFTNKMIEAGQYFGQEAAFSAPIYIGSAKASTNVEVLRLPAQDFARVLEQHHDMRTYVLFSMMRRLRRMLPFAISSSDASEQWHLFARLRVVGGWALSFLVPVIVYLLSWHSVSRMNVRIYISLLVAGMVMWIFKLIDPYIVGIFLVVTALVLRLAPAQVILAGYSSTTFFMALSIIGLGSVLINSGTLYRLLVNILDWIPPTQFWSNFSVFSLGVTMTTMVPVALKRVEVIAPFSHELTSQTNMQSNSKAVTKMALSAFSGVSLFSAIFLSGSLYNFVLLGLLWTQDQERFQWIGWFQAAAVPGLVLVLGFALPFLFVLKSDEKLNIDRDNVADQLRTLGPLTRVEKFTLICYGFLALGIITQSIHRLSPQLIGLFVLFAILALGVLTRDNFRHLINWPAIFLLGSLIGLANLFTYTHVNVLIIEHLGWLGGYIKSDFYLFVLLLLLIVSLVRLVVPYGLAVILLGAVFMPLAQQYEVNPWTVGFIILLFGNIWFYPAQYPPFQKFCRLNTEAHNVNRRTVLLYNLYMNFVKILAIYISIPYWKMLGVL